MHGAEAALLWVSPPGDVEHGEHSVKDSSVLLRTGGRSALVEDAPLMPLLLLVGDVILRAALEVRQDLIRLVVGVELHRISRQRLVRMVALGKKSVDTLDRIVVGRRTQLQGLVMIDKGVSLTPR